MLLINNSQNAMGIIPGKFFEYLSTHRPVLCIGIPESDVSKILQETSAGKTIGFEDTDGMKQYILELYGLYKSGKLGSVSNEIDTYSRKSICKQVANLLNEL
jgi:hypothetical protein